MDEHEDYPEGSLWADTSEIGVQTYQLVRLKGNDSWVAVNAYDGWNWHAPAWTPEQAVSGLERLE